MANTRRRTQRSSRTSNRIAARHRAIGEAGAMEAEKASSGTAVNWQNEMQYINKDLRDLTIVTVVLFALLFIVGFFL